MFIHETPLFPLVSRCCRFGFIGLRIIVLPEDNKKLIRGAITSFHTPNLPRRHIHSEHAPKEAHKSKVLFSATCSIVFYILYYTELNRQRKAAVPYVILLNIHTGCIIIVYHDGGRVGDSSDRSVALLFLSKGQ